MGGLCVWLSWSVWGVYRQERQTGENTERRLAQLEELLERERALDTEIERLSTDRGIEEEIRRKFEVAKAGEEVIVIVDTPASLGAGQQDAAAGFFGRFLDAIIFWK